MQLAVLMPVGPDEASRHLAKALRHAHAWADQLIVYGDAPDPDTEALIATFADHWQIGEESLYETGEHLVRNPLFEMADELLETGDIVACLDADEVLHATPERVRQVLSGLEHDPRESFNVHILHLWDEAGTLHRVDGAWQPSIGPRIYRHRPGYRLAPLYESAWVCPGLPPALLRESSPPILELLHWSYARAEDRAPKHERYTRLPGHSVAHVDSILTTPTLEPVPCR